MRFWVDVENQGHTINGVGPVFNLTRCTTRNRVNRAGEFSFELPATDERAVLISARQNALVYGMVNGARTFLGGGPIDKISTRIGSDGLPLMQVSGGDMLEELSRLSIGRLTLADAGGGDANIVTLLAQISSAPLLWSTSRENGSPNFQARLEYETKLNSLVTIAEKTGAYFRFNPLVMPSRQLDWFYSVADSLVVATMHGDPVALEGNANACLITDITIDQDSNDLKTRCFLFGSGEGAGQTNVLYAAHWPDGSSLGGSYSTSGQTFTFNRTLNYIVNTTAEASYGRDEIALAFKDIAPLSNSVADITAAGDFLIVAGLQYLLKNSQPYTSYKLRVAGLKQVLTPGTSILVQARRYRDGEKPIDLNERLFILEVENTIDASGIYTSGLTVANLNRWPVSDGEFIAQELKKTTVITAHQQTGPNVDTISYREAVDDGDLGVASIATMHFWLGEETTTVQSVIVRFRVDPLRSTVKSVAATGTTIGNESLHTHTINDHTHRHVVDYAGTPDRTITGTDVSGNIVLHYGGTNVGNLNYNTTPAGGTVVTSNSGSSHSHTFTPTINPLYGIFDDSPGNTYAATDLEWKTAADSTWTAVTSGDAIAGATGWYQVNITSRIVTDFRPLAAANNIQFRVRSAVFAGKKAQITAQIERRTSIQSIATF